MGIDLGAVAGGINKGIDWAQRDQQIEDQRAIQQEQMNQWRQENEYRAGLRKRQQDEFSREDKYRADMSAVPQVGADVQTMQEDSAGNMYGLSRKQTAISQARQQAQIAQNAGKFEEARKLNAWADDVGMKQAATAYQGYLSSYKGNDPYEFAQGAAKLVTDDQSPIGVTNVRKDENGRVVATLTNKSTGFQFDQPFNSIDDMKSALQAHYDPATYRANADAARKTREEIDKERAKGHVLPAGGQFVPGAGDTRQTVTNTTGMIPTAYDESGQPISWARAGSSGAAGTKGAAAGKPGADMKPYNDAFELMATKGEIKLQPAQIAVGQRVLYSLANKGLDAGTSAQIAHDVATNPASTSLQINGQTGSIDRVYSNPDINGGRSIVISSEAGSMADLKKSIPASELSKAASGVFSSMLASVPEEKRQASQEALIAAAINPSVRKQYIEAAANSGKDVTAINRKLDLIAEYGPKPQADRQANQQAAKPAVQAQGLYRPPEGSPAARSLEAREKARSAAAASEQQRAQEAAQISKQFNSDAATMEPIEFARKYDSMRSKLSTADLTTLNKAISNLR